MKLPADPKVHRGGQEELDPWTREERRDPGIGGVKPPMGKGPDHDQGTEQGTHQKFSLELCRLPFPERLFPIRTGFRHRDLQGGIARVLDRPSQLGQRRGPGKIKDNRLLRREVKARPGPTRNAGAGPPARPEAPSQSDRRSWRSASPGSEYRCWTPAPFALPSACLP